MNRFIVVVLLLAITGSMQVDLPAIASWLPAMPEGFTASEGELPEKPDPGPELLAMPSLRLERTLPAIRSANLPLLAVVNTTALNVRECASKSCRAIDWLVAGNQVRIFAGKNGWMRIGEGRWVYGKFVEIKEITIDRRVE